MSKLAEMTVLNVQMGLAIHIKSPNGKWIVIDLGSSSKGDENESPATDFIMQRVSYMVLTHPHMDHISDILNFDFAKPAILKHCGGLSDKEIMDQAGDDKDALKKYKKYVDIVNTYTYPVTDTNPDNPDYSNNYGGLEIETFSTEACNHSNINNLSIITVLKLGNAKVVVCGDNETASINELMKDERFKESVADAYVLVAPHHGRESAYHSDFVALVDPYITIISDGKYQDYSASDKYTNDSKGFEVYKRDGSKQIRYCLTTRNDGDIKVTFGTSDNPKSSGTLGVELI